MRLALVETAFVQHAVHEERRRTGNPAGRPGTYVGLDAARDRVRPEVRGELREIERKRGRVVTKVFGCKLLLVLEQAVVHGPEPPLPVGRLGGRGRAQRVRVRLRQRELTEHEGELVTQVFLYSFHVPVRLAAVGALEVAVLDELQGSVTAPADVVGIGDLDVEGVRHFALSASESVVRVFPWSSPAIPRGVRPTKSGYRAGMELTADARTHLRVYLNDHRAGAAGGQALAKRCLRNNPRSELGDTLRQLLPDLESEAKTLEDIIERLDTTANRAKQVLAVAGERAGSVEAERIVP